VNEAKQRNWDLALEGGNEQKNLKPVALTIHRQGVLAFLLPEIGYEAQILLNRDPSQTSALAMHCVFRIAHN